MSNLTTEKKAELKIEIAKFPTTSPQELAIKFAITTREVAGLRRSLTVDSQKAIVTVSEPTKKVYYVKLTQEQKDAKKQAKIDAKKSIDNKIVTNSYTNENGEKKNIAREVMVRYINESKVVGSVLTLPHIKCKIEKMILSENTDFSFVGVERDKETYLEMCKTIKSEKLPIVPKLGLISNEIYGKNANTYAHMVLDYCGELPSITKEIEYSIDNNLLVVGGIMAITFGKPIRSSGENALKVRELGQTISNCQGDNRCQSDRCVEAFFHKTCGKDYRFVEIFNYMDTYPMTLIILERIR